MGLSPRVWGSPPVSVIWEGAVGSIPTCVGQPNPGAVFHAAIEVYPHVCGAAFSQHAL